MSSHTSSTTSRTGPHHSCNVAGRPVTAIDSYVRFNPKVLHMSSPNHCCLGQQRRCETWRTTGCPSPTIFADDCGRVGQAKCILPRLHLLRWNRGTSHLAICKHPGHEVECLGKPRSPQHRPNLRILRDLWLSGLCGLSQTSMPGVVRSGLAVGGSSALGGGAVESEALPHVWLAARYVSYLLCSCSCSTIIKFCQRSDVCLGQAKQHRLL